MSNRIKEIEERYEDCKYSDYHEYVDIRYLLDEVKLLKRERADDSFFTFNLGIRHGELLVKLEKLEAVRDAAKKIDLDCFKLKGIAIGNPCGKCAGCKLDFAIQAAEQE